MNRFLMVAAVLAIGLIDAVSAHATGGVSGAKAVAKRTAIQFKNIGAQTVQVNAKAGDIASGGVATPQNGVATIYVNQGTFTAVARGVSNNITKTYSSTADSSAPIYLFVEADATATTITLAPQ